MLTLNEIRNGILEIARKQLGRDAVKRVEVEEDVDLDGKDSLRITIVVKNRKTIQSANLNKLTIDAVDFLQEAGDTRFPYTHYATEAELKALAAAHD